MSSLIYIADPMCSWCYAFGPELTALAEGLSGVPIHVVVGGLRAGNKKPMDDDLKSTLREHWNKVAERTGLPISYANLEREGFVYDTEPACRAVVAVRELAPQASLSAFYAIQRAFYTQGKDVTKGNVLAEVVVAALSEAGVALDVSAFLAAWESDAVKAATQADFEQVKRWEVRGFPTLVLERESALDLVASGYVPMPTLVETLEALVDSKESNDD
jgi:putative protein-disulfide isomerase